MTHTGKLQVTVNPMEVSSVLKRNNSTYKSWNGSKYLSNLPIGNYTITATCSGYKAETKQVKIKLDETKKVNIALEKNRIKESKKQTTENTKRLERNNNQPEVKGVGNIAGRVTNKKSGQQFALVAVILVGTDQGTYTKKNGTFILTRVPTGIVEVQVRYWDYKTKTFKVEVNENETAIMNIKMEK